MLQFLAAVGLALALSFSAHLQPMDGSGGPPNATATMAPLSATPTPPPPDGSGGPPNK